MTSDLIVTVRFPTGFFGGESDGAPEWPPTPSRVAAALLGAAGDTRRSCVNELFAAPAPTIDAPVAEPSFGPSTWVPSAYTLQKSGGKWELARPGTNPQGEYLERKDPSRTRAATHVGQGQVHYRWPGLGGLAAELAQVAADVAYIGRPNSPAVVFVRSTDESPPSTPNEGRFLFVPDRDGPVRMGAPSVAYLDSLDAVHQSRQVTASVGYDQPVRTRRTFTTYRTVRPVVQGAGVGLQTPLGARAWLDGQVLYRLARGQTVQGGDVQFALDAITAELKATTVTPVLWSVGGHCPDGRLKSVLVDDPNVPELPAEIEALTRSGIVRLQYTSTADVPTDSLESWTAKRVLGRSPLWTTAVPAKFGLDATRTLHRAQGQLEADGGSEVVGFATHSEPRAAWQLFFPERAESGYVSVQFANSAQGPLFLQAGDTRVALLPVSPGTDDPDQKMGHLL